MKVMSIRCFRVECIAYFARSADLPSTKRTDLFKVTNKTLLMIKGLKDFDFAELVVLCMCYPGVRDSFREPL